MTGNDRLTRCDVYIIFINNKTNNVWSCLLKHLFSVFKQKMIFYSLLKENLFSKNLN